MISAPYAEYAEALPAIALAGLLPTVLLAKDSKRAVQDSQKPLSQRLEVLSKHVIVNVVDNKHCLTEVNAEFEKVTGYSQADVLGKPVNMLYFDDIARRDADPALQSRWQLGGLHFRPHRCDPCQSTDGRAGDGRKP